MFASAALWLVASSSTIPCGRRHIRKATLHIAFTNQAHDTAGSVDENPAQLGKAAHAAVF